MKMLLSLFTTLLAACTGGPPGGLSVVDNFELERYQGQWDTTALALHE